MILEVLQTSMHITDKIWTSMEVHKLLLKSTCWDTEIIANKYVYNLLLQKAMIPKLLWTSTMATSFIVQDLLGIVLAN